MSLNSHEHFHHNSSVPYSNAALCLTGMSDVGAGNHVTPDSDFVLIVKPIRAVQSVRLLLELVFSSFTGVLTQKLIKIVSLKLPSIELLQLT